MTKGFDANQQRIGLISSFGKELTRRARSKCELCEASGESLVIYEIPPTSREPRIDQCVIICKTCSEQLEHPKRMEDSRWRCLTNAIWSDVPAVQILALRLLRRIAPREAWASEVLDQAMLEPEIEARAAEAK